MFANRAALLLPEKCRVIRLLVRELLSPRSKVLVHIMHSTNPVMALLTQYLERRIAAGELRGHQPLVPIHMLVSSLLILLLIDQPLESHVAQLVDTLLNRHPCHRITRYIMTLDQKLHTGIRTLLKHTLNSLTRRLARTKVGPFALIQHVGRRSGKQYETPVIFGSVADGFVAELTVPLCPLVQERASRRTLHCDCARQAVHHQQDRTDGC